GSRAFGGLDRLSSGSLCLEQRNRRGEQILKALAESTFEEIVGERVRAEPLEGRHRTLQMARGIVEPAGRGERAGPGPGPVEPLVGRWRVQQADRLIGYLQRA